MIIRYLDPWGPGPCPVRLMPLAFRLLFKEHCFFSGPNFIPMRCTTSFLNPACAILGTELPLGKHPSYHSDHEHWGLYASTRSTPVEAKYPS